MVVSEVVVEVVVSAFVGGDRSFGCSLWRKALASDIRHQWSSFGTAEEAAAAEFSFLI